MVAAGVAAWRATGTDHQASTQWCRVASSSDYDDINTHFGCLHRQYTAALRCEHLNSSDIVYNDSISTHCGCLYSQYWYTAVLRREQLKPSAQPQCMRETMLTVGNVHHDGTNTHCGCLHSQYTAVLRREQLRSSLQTQCILETMLSAASRIDQDSVGVGDTAAVVVEDSSPSAAAHLHCGSRSHRSGATVESTARISPATGVFYGDYSSRTASTDLVHPYMYVMYKSALLASISGCLLMEQNAIS